MIEATERHLLPTTGSPRFLADCALFLDMDLSILGAPTAVFARYEADIRREYAMVPEDAYRAGRSAVLERFLARDRLYFSDYFHARLEAPARCNLAASLVALRARVP
jgi:predicted metal-dependent HD superfamily phosphohydrolase